MGTGNDATQPTTTPAATPPLDFSAIPGHLDHGTNATIGPDTSKERNKAAAQDIATSGLRHPLDTAGRAVDAVSNFTEPIENYTQEGRAAHPILSRLGDVTRGIKEELIGGQSAGKPLGTSEGIANNPLTGLIVGPEGTVEDMETAANLVKTYGARGLDHLLETGKVAYTAGRDELLAGLNAKAPIGSTEAGSIPLGNKPKPNFDSISGHETVDPVPPGQPHTRQVVTIDPQVFIDKVSRGKINPNQVNHYREMLRNGEEVKPSMIYYDENGNIKDADGRHRALAHMQEGAPLKVEVIRDLPKEEAATEAAAEAPKTEGTTKPNEQVAASANRYAHDTLDHSPAELASKEARNTLADQYDQARHEPNSPEVQRAYKAFKNETLDQFKHAQNDLGIKFDFTNEDPYKSAEEMQRDVRENHHLSVFTGGDLPADHPMAEIEPETGQPYNNIFRATHDIYGHSAGGHDFSENGEESAFKSHNQMYSPEAQKAMRTETQGQSNWYFNNRDVRNGGQQGFPEQKATILPKAKAEAAQKDTEPTAEKTNEPTQPKETLDPYAIRNGETSISADGKYVHGSSPESTGPDKVLTQASFVNGKHMFRVVVPDEDMTRAQIDALKRATKVALADGGSLRLLNTDGRISQFEATSGTHAANHVESLLSEVGAHPDDKWYNKVSQISEKQVAGGIDPSSGKMDHEGIGVEVYPEARKNLDHAPTAQDFRDYYREHSDLFVKHPELRIGWDNDSAVPGGHEINIGAVGPGAERVGKKLDQKSAFDIKKGEVIPTGGQGLRTEFPNYSLNERMKDLKGEPLSIRKNFEHLSYDVYNHLEPDERTYLEGNKTLQKNVMKQYHALEPSVAETTEAMKAGASLGGWWQRYMDIFHDLVGDNGAKPEGIPLFHGTKATFDNFDPLRNGSSGDFGIHMGSKEQAEDRLGAYSPSPAYQPTPAGQNTRPVYANIKNPIRLEDHGQWKPSDIARQLLKKGIISDAEYSKLGSEIRPETIRDLMESKGYDGIEYLNRYENVPGRAVPARDESDAEYLAHPANAPFRNQLANNKSYIAFRPEQVTPKYEAEAVAAKLGPSHAETLKQWHAALSGNKSVEDANNLAWHSYADWLDAGKPTDRESIDAIIRKNGAQPEGSGKRGNAAISDTRDKKGNLVGSGGLDTNKLFNLVNSPEMRGERRFGNSVFADESAKNPLMGTTEGARKIPSMGATVAGKGNLNRLVIDAHIRDFFGHTNSGGPAAQYLADSALLRQAAEQLGLKGGEGQEQLWGTVLGLKQLLKQGLTPEEAAGKLNSDVIRGIGKDYAEVIANDPEISKPGGILDRLKEKYGIGQGSAGISERPNGVSGTNSETRRANSGPAQSGPAEDSVDKARLKATASRILGTISPSKIKKPAVAVIPKKGPVNMMDLLSALKKK